MQKKLNLHVCIHCVYLSHLQMPYYFPFKSFLQKASHVHGEWIMTYKVFRIEWLTLSKPQLLWVHMFGSN